jgi:hypothetical protein
MSLAPRIDADKLGAAVQKVPAEPALALGQEDRNEPQYEDQRGEHEPQSLLRRIMANGR